MSEDACHDARLALVQLVAVRVIEPGLIEHEIDLLLGQLLALINHAHEETQPPGQIHIPLRYGLKLGVVVLAMLGDRGRQATQRRESQILG